MQCFSPRSGHTKHLDDFLEAQVEGHKLGDCKRRYGKCPFSVANVIGNAEIRV